jgi:hypothetical protein
MRGHRLPIPALAFLLACGGGGGGGGTPLQNPPRIVLADVDVPAGQVRGTIDLGVAAEGEAPVLVQLDLVADPARIRFGNEVEALSGIATAEAGLVEPGRLRIVFGDATRKDAPQKLPTGAVVRVPFEALVLDRPASVEVRVEGILASDAVGSEETVDQAGPTATIRLR